MLAGVPLGSATQELDPDVLLEGYNLCNKEFETISYDLESDSQSRRRQLVYTTKHCARGDCKQWIGHRTLTMYNEDGTTQPAIRERVADTYDGTQLANIYWDPPGNPPKANLWGTAGGLLPKISQEWAQNIEKGGPLVGRIYGSNFHSVYDLLKGAPNVTLHDTATKILDYDAYLLEANTPYGIVRAWISPDAGNNCLKWEIVKAQNQFYLEGETTDGQFTHWVAAYDAERVEQIDGRYITTQAKLKHIVTDGDTEISNYTNHYKLTNIDFDPDYEAMGAFEIQLPEGTVVYYDDFPGVIYQWIGGRLQPLIDDMVIEAIDTNVDKLVENRNAVSKEEVEKSEGNGAVKRAASVDSEQLSDRKTTKIEDEQKNDSRTNGKKLMGGVVIVVVILGVAFFVYSFRRKVGNNEM